MIVEMVQVHMVARAGERDRFLDALGRLGVLHLKPVDPGEVPADAEILQSLEDLDRAMNILAPMSPPATRAGSGSSVSPLEAARKAVRLWSAVTEGKVRLGELESKVRERSVWGDVTLQQLEALGEGGIEVGFFRIPRELLPEIEAECVHVAADLQKGHVLAAVIDRLDRWKPPPWAEPVPFPDRDRPSLMAEAAEIHENIRQALGELSELAGLRESMGAERRRLSVEMEFATAGNSGLNRGGLFAVQGWVPREGAGNLAAELAALGITAGVRTLPVPEEETPPTLIRYPSWARPMKGLFDMLGTLPGYRETDMSPFFMVALPVFAAMLVSDAGYGLLLAAAGVFFHRRLAAKVGRPRVHLLVLFGLAAFLWGVLTANYFGVGPETLARSGGFVTPGEGGAAAVDYAALWTGDGFYARTAGWMRQAAPLWREDSGDMRVLLMQVSLLLGCLHLLVARLRRFVEMLPDQRALAELGWLVVIGDVLVLIWYLLFEGIDRLPPAVGWVLACGVILIAGFGRPHRNLVKRIGLGFFASVLPLLGTFSDTMSYIRLFAVGLASTYIAGAFNMLGAQVAEVAGWSAGAPVVVFGHALNMALAAIAIFAHGVRLNMLEFSNNTGVQWSGYAYRPFHGVREGARGDKTS